MRRQLIALLAAAVPLTAALAPAAPAVALAPSTAHSSAPTAAPAGVSLTAAEDSRSGAGSAKGCATFPVSAPTGTFVQSVTAVAQPGGTITFPEVPGFPPTPPVTDVPAWCDVTVTLTHPGAGDHVTVKIALPQKAADWNGRLQATGGSAYLAGDLNGAAMMSAVKGGYVATATDAGVGANPFDVSAWALINKGNSSGDEASKDKAAKGKVNTALLENFSSRSLHDMAVVGKDVTKRFYGQKVNYAYWNGCSTGGRQGYQEAQAYPEDFDGILANAPAVDWDRFAVATLWSQAVFNEEKVAPSQCELTAFTNAAVAACDANDGVKDGVIDNPQRCDFDPRRLVGTKVVCDGKEITISAATATAVRKIWEGPVSRTGEKLWYGPNKGASLSSLAQVGVPFFVADNWVKYFVLRDPSFDTTKLTYRQFDRIFRESQAKFDPIIGSDDPDLSGFAAAGGKLLTFHGQADQLVPTQGTVDYRERVNRVMGGNERVDDFYRLFLLPGVEHCVGGTGPYPNDAFGALVQWVEQAKAPDTLAATAKAADGRVITRQVCRYPMIARYTGHGDTADAANYRCKAA